MVGAASARARPLPDISVETAGKLERLITEPSAHRSAAELWQNRNKPALNAGHAGECVRLRFVLSKSGDNLLDVTYVPAHLLIRSRSGADCDTRRSQKRDGDRWQNRTAIVPRTRGISRGKTNDRRACLVVEKQFRNFPKRIYPRNHWTRGFARFNGGYTFSADYRFSPGRRRRPRFFFSYKKTVRDAIARRSSRG